MGELICSPILNMIRGIGYSEAIKGYKQWNLTKENVKMLFDTFDNMAITEYFYENISKKNVWADEWVDGHFGMTLNWIKEYITKELSFYKFKKLKHEKRFFIKRDKLGCLVFVYARDITREKKDLYISFYNEGITMPPIYILSAFEKLKFNKNLQGIFGAKRIMGFFYKKDEAEEFIKNNALTLSHDGLLRYATIEKRLSGIPSLTLEVDYFQYKNNKFVKINKPFKMNDTIFASIG